MTAKTVLTNLVDQAFEKNTFPEAARDKAATCLADFLSCALEAADLPWSRQSFALAAGRAGDCVIVGEAGGFTAEDAAFANAVRGHGLVREDMHAGSLSHMGVVIWPVLLSLAGEAADLKTRPLDAAIAGYEIGGRIGRALMTPEMARLFRPTGLIGPLSGTLAGALLLGLDRQTTVNALALAINTAGGLNEWPHSGADDMYFHPGFASRNVLTALRLARLGAHGSASAIDGVAGLFAAFGRQKAPREFVLYPDGECEIMAVFNKEVPACNFAQSPCQVALSAAQRVGAGDSIKAIHLSTYAAALNYPGCAYRGPFETPLQAKMSIYFGMAAAIARGEIAEANYAMLDDPRIAELIGMTSVSISDDLNRAFPAQQGARVRIETTAGAVIEEALDDIRSASPGLVRARLAKVAKARLGAGRAGDLDRAIDHLADGGNDTASLAALAGLAAAEVGERVS
ncbi:MmgE/PrpD family protein [Martelella soudanensis]|uniref:MmgE/PrpD family protein n=1 Tax=unclassified Martelella TaxID=2629616 RepID=UPI0015E03510|nr:MULTISPECIES: MmgE/PrpD family protein [unclassified Martelella]